MAKHLQRCAWCANWTPITKRTPRLEYAYHTKFFCSVGHKRVQIRREKEEAERRASNPVYDGFPLD